MTVTEERRAAPRYPLILVAEMLVEESGAKAVARTSDVSRTGCYIDTLNPITPGTIIQLKFQQGGESFQTRARIVYDVSPMGMGVQFVDVDETQLAILDCWLSVAATEG
jgi:hypothetical protein